MTALKAHVVLAALLLGCGSSPRKDGGTGFLPSGLSAGRECKPDLCGGVPEPEPAACRDGTTAAPMCMSDATDQCHWEPAQCPTK